MGVYVACQSESGAGHRPTHLGTSLAASIWTRCSGMLKIHLPQFSLWMKWAFIEF